MSQSAKLTFKITHMSDPKLPFIIVTVPEEAPLATLLRYSREKLNLNASSSISLTNDNGSAIQSTMTTGEVFLTYGYELALTST